MKASTFNASMFMGNEDAVRRYHRKYASLFRPGQEVLDLGCGTGTFLDLLRERGVKGTGVDAFAPAVEACSGKGLDAVRQDIHAYLKRTKHRYDGIMCSHIVEHFPPEKVFELMEGAFRVLRPGGRLIILTPNSANLHVMTESFWMDITHVRPYPGRLLQAMLEHVGFETIKHGFDDDPPETNIDLRHPRGTLRFLLNRCRWGKYYGKGDTFVLATAPGEKS